MTITLIKINGTLSIDSSHMRMKRLLAKIDTTEDQRTLRLLNRAWWREWFREQERLHS